jgi:hypothetical protein
MTFRLLLYCVAAVALVLLGGLFRTGRNPAWPVKAGVNWPPR